MSLTFGMNISQQALLVNQAAINMVSNNISNVNTDGYSRQRVNLQPNVNFTPIGGSVLTQVNSASGVDLASITRYTDSYLTSYYREQNSTLNYLGQFQTVASSVESVMNELKGAGLSDAFTNFYKAVQTLSSDPKNSIARSDFANQAQSIAFKFNSMSNSLTTLRTSLVGNPGDPTTLATSKISTSVGDVNQKLQQIAKINSQVVGITSADMAPNNLLDIRDKLITELSELIPVNVTDNNNGTVNLSINGINIIKGTELLGTLSVNSGDTTTPAIINIVDTNSNVVASNINNSITAGKVGALLDAGGSRTDILSVKSISDKLDNLANGFAKIINDIQTQVQGTMTPMAIDKNTMTLVAATENIFESKSGGAITASNIQINNDIINDPYLIATARVDTSVAYDNKGIGNNNNIQMMYDSRTKTYAQFGNTSPEGYLANIVGEVGLKVQNIKTNVKSQTQVTLEIQNKLKSATGVNMDEELSDLIKYQRAYQASARVFNTCNELLETLINLGR